MQKHVLYILIFVICGSCHVKDDVQLPKVESEKIVLPTIKMEDKYQFFVDRFLDTINMAMDDRACPGLAITIVHDSTILALQGIGLANEQTGKPVSAETIFRLGSVSKGFAAVLTQILVKEGYLSWDDPIIKYIPEFAFRDTEQSDQITIHHLLSQSTGLPPHTFTNYLESGKDVSVILHMLEGVNTVANPGEICTYQNVTYALIEEILEKATGKPFEQLLKEKIFTPLDMKNASTSCDAIAAAEMRSSPHQFNRYEDKYMPIPYNEKYYNAISAGGINASINDMQKYLQLLLGNQPEILDAATIAQFFKPNVPSDYERKYFHRWDGLWHNSYGLGWRVFDFSGDIWAYHGGFVNGYRAEIAINQTSKVGICMLFNASCGLPDYAMKVFFERFNQDRVCRQEQL